jgi:hypothetical protein
MSDGPKRYESTELTIVIPRDALAPPASTVPGPTIEQLADLARAERDAQDEIETATECPCCSGTGIVDFARRAELQMLLSWESSRK